jgi:putative membrane protein
MYRPYGAGVVWASAIWHIVVLVLIVVGIVLLVRWLARSGGHFHAHHHHELPSGTPAAGGALQILEERFARGEIDEDEFKRRKDALRS